MSTTTTHRLQIAASGETIVIQKSGRDTEGQYFQFEDHIRKGSNGPPAHVHIQQAETFTVKHGVLLLKADGVWHTLSAGQTFTVPAGVPHTLKTGDSEDLMMEVTFSPALDTEVFFRNMATAQSNILQIAVLNQELESRFYFAHIPPRLQDLLFGILAIPARWLGYHVQ